MITSTKSVRECRRCLYTDRHPFGLFFDETGLCTGCITHEAKHTLDWENRFHLLQEKTSNALRKKSSEYYDCILPVRGTPEHFFVVDVVKNRLGLNPLVVSYNSQFNSRIGIQNLDRLRDVFDVDILIYTSNPFTYRKLIRESLVRMDSIRWPYIAGETSFPVYTAVERSIPLVIWPYHQATEQVGMHSYEEEPEMSRRSRASFDLLGIEPDEMIATETTVTEKDVHDLLYPANHMLDRHGITGIYLSNYLPWDTRRFSEEMVKRCGALAGKNTRTFDTYERIDDMTYMSIHDVLKYAKLGYSRVTDSLCREIRFGRITKDDARQVEAYYQGHGPGSGLDIFLEWLGMTREAFGWYLERLPFHHAGESTDIKLTASQQTFVDSFIRNGPSVMDGDRFTIYGKGLEFDEDIAEWRCHQEA